MVKKVRTGNTDFGTDTDSIKVPVGTTAQRNRALGGGGFEVGTIRYNSSLAALEYYNGDWVVLDVAPTISSISPTNIVADGSTTTEVTITGTGFNAGTAITLISDDAASQITPATITQVSATSIKFTCGGSQITDVTGVGADFNNAKTPFDIKVASASGKSNTLDNALSINATPYWVSSGGNLTNSFSSNRSVSVSVEAKDPDSQAITYSVTDGALPGGVSLNANTGAITGTDSNPGSITTYNFEITASDGTNTNNQSYSIVSYPATTETFNASGTFTVPSGLTSVDVLVVAGGGCGGGQCGLGGGGAGGGLIYRPGKSVTPGSPLAVTVGGSGTGGWDGNQPSATGGDSVFSDLTAKGGGAGGGFSVGRPGGSGGGGGGNSFQGGSQPGGTGTQPQQGGESAQYGFGNPGGSGSPNNGPSKGGGGGGAGGSGQPAPSPSSAGNGGGGRSYSISGSSTDYSGGGAATNANSSPTSGGSSGQAGQTNRGGGGGGQSQAGGSGIVIVTY